MGTTNQEGIDRVIAAFPPKKEVLLTGWVVVAEWMDAGGDRFISRMLSDGSTPWQAKGYLYEGLNGSWPYNPEHHNPGQPPGSMRREDD
jgi:hypothetical protein